MFSLNIFVLVIKARCKTTYLYLFHVHYIVIVQYILKLIYIYAETMNIPQVWHGDPYHMPSNQGHIQGQYHSHYHGQPDNHSRQYHPHNPFGQHQTNYRSSSASHHIPKYCPSRQQERHCSTAASQSSKSESNKKDKLSLGGKLPHN